MTHWITDRMPDEGVIVLIRKDNRSVPLEMGYRHSGQWRSRAGGTIGSRYINGWLPLQDAARLLDTTPTNDLRKGE